MIRILFFLLLFPVFLNAQILQEEKLAASDAQQHASLLSFQGTKTGEGFDMNFVRFRFYLNAESRYIWGSVIHHFTVLQAGLSYAEFDFTDSLSVDSVCYRKQARSYTRLNNVLRITLDTLLPAGARDSVFIYYRGVPPENGFGSFAQGSHGQDSVLWTLSEPYGAPDWWPTKQCLNDKIDSVEFVFYVPLGQKAVANGMLTREMNQCPSMVFHWKHCYPIAPYLVGMAVTNYERYSDYVHTGWDSIEVVNYVFPENLSTAQAATPAIEGMMLRFMELFGDYPFRKERYGQAQYGMGGGMEHQTMTFLGSFDWSLMAHELAHSWFGNRITCSNWHDIWLNEGLATFATSTLFEWDPPAYVTWKKQHVAYITSQPDGSVWCPDTTDIYRIFSNRLSYSKGGMVMNTLRFQLGDTVFFNGINAYLNDPLLRYGYANTADFKAHMEAACNCDLTDFFTQWI